ncbi:hypothetical protein PF003_g2960 [Phytophthora fragariae]|nr:hypothetical protein PF003_g2960 [Phytophthora fragariae]
MNHSRVFYRKFRKIRYRKQVRVVVLTAHRIEPNEEISA